MPVPRSSLFPRLRWWLVGALAIAALAALWLHPRGSVRWRPPAPPVVALDADRNRATVDARRAAALRLSEATAARPQRVHPSSTGRLLRRLIDPACILGPRPLCELLASSVAACADGDGATCHAVGRFLEESPPYPEIARWFFGAGCSAVTPRRARAAQIRRQRRLRRRSARCMARARRTDDLAALDHLCAGGMADACVVAGVAYLDEPIGLRGYLTAACQAGGTPACFELARRLTPTCTGDCMGPDAAQAEVAAAIACDAGFADACQLAAR
jgi:hypothetical protein